MAKERIGKILLSEDVIHERVKEIGHQVSEDYSGREITIVCVLKGAVVFLADLIRNIDIPVELDFVQVSSYGNNTESTGKIDFLQCLSTDIEGRHVLVIDDIVDSGLTLCHLRDVLLAMRPASLRFCAFLDKAERRTEDIKMDYVGFNIPNAFVVGYGLDHAGRYRGLRYIAELEV